MLSLEHTHVYAVPVDNPATFVEVDPRTFYLDRCKESAQSTQLLHRLLMAIEADLPVRAAASTRLDWSV